VLERGWGPSYSQGRENALELSLEPLRDVARWISRYERFWNARLDRLERFFAVDGLFYFAVKQEGRIRGFRPRGDQCEVTLRHSGVPDDEMGHRHQEGWTSVLSMLAERFGSGASSPASA
jgi:hypothetical protein